MSHETAAKLGGDFDGDFYQVVPAARFPTIAACIRRFSHRQEYRVPDIPKVKFATPVSGEISPAWPWIRWTTRRD